MSDAPRARVETVTDDYFGTTIEDPYRWLEDWQSPEARAYLEGQGAHARAYLDAIPERAELLARLTELRDAGPVFSGLQRAGGRTFYLRREPQENLAKLVVRDTPEAEERVLFDPNALEGDVHTAIDWYSASRDGSLVAYGISPGGSENSTLHVMDVTTGETLPDRITRCRFGGPVWRDDHRSFYYNRLRDLPDDAPDLYFDSAVHLHVLGTDPEEDPTVFSRETNPSAALAPTDLPFVFAPQGSDWVIGLAVHGVQRELTLYAVRATDLSQPATCRWTSICDVDDKVTSFEVDADTIYLLTFRDAPRYKITVTDLNAPDARGAETVVPESSVVIQGMAVVGDALLVQDLDAGIDRVRQFPKGGGEAYDVPLPVEGSILGWAAEHGASDVLVLLQSWTVAPQIYRYTTDTRTVEDTQWVPLPTVDMSDIQVTETFAPAPDGTAIPLTIIHRRDLPLDGENPTLLVGYGSYGMTYPVAYSPQMRAWYERGGVFAIAHIRGGGEYGREWHEAGRLLNKTNTIDDFIACAEYLIREGYTSPERLAGEGTSAGGIPSGGALVKRPDLWAVMVIRVALTDALRFQFSPNGPPNVPEFGDVTTPEGFEALQLVSSYHKVRDGERYGAVFLTTGLNDPRVVPWQATKMAARLQAATGSDRPILLRVETQGGHGMGSTRRQLDEELADKLAFLLQQFGLSAASPSRQDQLVS